MFTADVIVIGGGHAGIEAAHSAASMGSRVVLVTINLDMIGQASCNPAIGGIAKGNIVREIDALGGVMGKLADAAGIHFRMLNISKGSAVWGPRAQIDKKLYRTKSKQLLENTSGVHIYQGSVSRILTNGPAVSGVVLVSGEEISAKAVVLCGGTFLNGLGHIGSNSFPCGRIGEPASLGLTESIMDLGIKAGRLKTGTPARVDAKTINLDTLLVQPGDDNPWPFSYSTHHTLKNTVCCYQVKTNFVTHTIIKDNIHRSALYSGKITGIGPRYCPSIEDKIVRFGERDGHTLFLEPEGVDTHEMYVNGFSTSLPVDVQVAMMRSLHGFENAHILRPAYAIEYDYFFPTQLFPTLESRIIRNLFFAGQVNGTSGYEEAGCQGLVAGINAAANVLGKEPLVLGRETSYTGVLLDDLVTRGTEEPYRMFTSRAEHRLLLRQDNADERLMPEAYRRGLISRELFEERQKLWEKKASLIEYLEKTRISPDTWQKQGFGELRQHCSGAELVKRPGVSVHQVLGTLLRDENIDRDLCLRVESDIKYSGFIEKQTLDIKKLAIYENTKIPEYFDYDSVKGLLTESRIKFKKINPLTLGQALRISGVTPADITLLIMHLGKK